MIVGIDATRSRSGGACSHLMSILTGFDPTKLGISRVHLWSFEEMIRQIPDYPWLSKYIPTVTKRGIFSQLFWQFYRLPRIASDAKCTLLFNTDAGTVCPFSPSITLSQDMLSFEPGEKERYGIGLQRLRLEILKYIQIRSLSSSEVAVFLTRHAERTISMSVDSFKSTVVIPHGVENIFRRHYSERHWPADSRKKLFIYVSNAALYKHQWNVVRAFAKVRKSTGLDLQLLLVGGGKGTAQKRLNEALAEVDPRNEFVTQKEFVPHHFIPDLLKNSNAFIFASSCENMPVTLIEAMASSLPILSSDRGPMKEVLRDGGVYFDPENTETIANAITMILFAPSIRDFISCRAYEISLEYTWDRCARETWSIIAATAANLQLKK